MPLPFIIGALGAKVVLGAAVATGVVGAAKGVKGAMDTSEAKSVQERAEDILEEAKTKVESAKAATTKSIENLGKTKLQLSGTEINRYVNLFSKIKNIELTESAGLEELRKLNITKHSLQEMREVSLSAKEVISGGIAGVGAGVLLGWGTYGGVMALGTASTGAAIGGLSGVAATNATLAWLGGGALAAGGGGMALGTAVLGGIVAGPALLLAGGIYGAKAKEKLNNAYSNLAEARKIDAELKAVNKELRFIKGKATQLNSLLKKISKQFKFSLNAMENVVKEKNNWREFTEEEKKIIMVSTKYAQVVKMIIDAPLLNENGVITTEVKGILTDKEVSMFSKNTVEEILQLS